MKLMIITLLLSCSLLCCLLTSAQSTILREGLVIKKSTKVKRATYRIAAPSDLHRSAIVINGNNITVDFNDAVLVGSNVQKLPNEFEGVAVIIRGGKNITVKNLKAKGYKVALLASNVENLSIENCDFSYNYRQHLNSTQEKEDIADWMSYHKNEDDQWLRYGAAIYLKGCSSANITNNKVTGGQNALMMMECNNSMIYNNDFSFNSGIGLGMYKCSNNKVLFNRIIFNVRGYSHGVYNRGQDSAGILVYEQSNNNLFYKNAVTHSGDGFFLWAGQTTMDTGKGGCNDNIILDNDFSYAPTNGIEVTFSRNKIFRNRMFECDHGIWGGYSYNTEIKENKFRNNRIAIAIEHGQNNDIHHNLFMQDKEAIRLWARREQPADWAYAKYRDTRSHNYNIVGNSFNNHPLVFNIALTDSLNVFDNRISFSDFVYDIDSTVTNLDTLGNDALANKFSTDTMIQIPEGKNAMDPFRGYGHLAGRKNIFITEWGPYDFRYPVFWNSNPVDTSGVMNFYVKGPAGKWKIVSAKGVEQLSKQSGASGDSITAKKIVGSRTDIEIKAEYIGQAFIDQFGKKVAANKPYRFTFRKFFQPINFMVKWFAFDSANNPITTNSISALQRLQPFKTESANKLDYSWWGGIKAENNHHEQFLTVAEGDANLLPGTYELGITWDDAVRVYVDGKLIVDEWNPSLYKFDESPHKTVKLQLGGKHHFRVEHVELGGFATLSLKLKKL